MGVQGTRDRRPDRRTASVLLLVAVLLHNAEEGVSYAATRAEAAQLLRGIWPAFEAPTATQFQTALAVLSAAVVAMLAWAALTKSDSEAWLVLRVTASVLLLNVIIPHVPAAIALGGYSPGVITAVAVNVPVSLWILRSRRRSAF